jgi:HEAT repeat protein
VKRAVLAAALVACSGASVADLAVPTEGWASWEVPAADGAPNWCCIRWKRNLATHTACDLDAKNGSFGNSDRDDTADTMRVYARFAAGKLERLRTFGSACEVTTQTPVRDLGRVRAEESARWLSSQLPRDGKRFIDDALASLSAHRGSVPTLTRLASTDANPRIRSQAWFWLAQVRAPETESAIAATLKNETDRHVREQAIFALSQLPGERGAKALAAIASDTSLPREDRKHAIFWMGQSDSPFATAYLDRLLGGK